MLNIFHEANVFIESEKLDEVIETLKTFNSLSEIYISNVAKTFNETSYRRVSMFVPDQMKEKFYSYLNEEYDGNAIVIE